MTKKLNILGDDGDDLNFSINSSYAKKYEDRKRKEEIGHLEDKYKSNLQKKGLLEKIQQRNGRNESDLPGDDGEESFTESDSESDEEEDDDGELLTPAVDAQILKTLSEIRSRTEKVYDSKVNFFEEEELGKLDNDWKSRKNQNQIKDKRPKPAKAVTLKDYHRERVLSGKVLDGSDSESESEQAPLTHVQEQELLKAEMKKAFNSGDAESDDDDHTHNSLLQKREKTEDEIFKEEEEYRNFLLENLSTSVNAKESMNEWLSYREERDGKSEKDSKSKKQLTEDDFLIDYVLNKGWVDKQASRVPTYDQIINEDIQDEESCEKAEEYEFTHNFRYEQEGGAQIQTFSRTVEGSMRREESKRKDQRMSAKERKEHDRLQKTEELKRLKNLKMAEIKGKLEKIQKVASIKDIPTEEIYEDLENDFDPVKHDRLMEKLAKNESDEEGKPDFSSDSEIDFSSSDEEDKPVIKKATKALKKAVKKLSSEHEQEQETEDGKYEKARLSKYMEELYNMDYEDLIGDIPCRFKYQTVEANTFGLSIDEIVSTDDSKLNSYFSLKKLAPYRPAEKQMMDAKKFASKHRLKQFRKTLDYKKKSNKNKKSKTE